MTEEQRRLAERLERLGKQKATPELRITSADELIAWLNSDSLDWDAIERGDHWSD